jgi:Na+/melibiose symporter-like transporter
MTVMSVFITFIPADPTRPFDAVGAILSAVGMFFVVFGILQAGTNNALFTAFLVLGLALLIGFFFYIRARERQGKEALLSTRVFRNRTCNLALVTQNIQWLLLMGVSFTVSVFLQEVRGYSAIGTGVVFTAATLGVLVSSFAAQRLARKYSQRTLIVAGFLVTLAGIGLLLGFVHSSSRVVAFVPGLLLIGLGLGAMLTPSVNVVQSSFPEALQGEISGLSRSVSNLGSTFGTAIAGTILVSVVRSRDDHPRPVRADRSPRRPTPTYENREGLVRRSPALRPSEGKRPLPWAVSTPSHGRLRLSGGYFASPCRTRVAHIPGSTEPSWVDRRP